jgi:hypothetical protein
MGPQPRDRDASLSRGDALDIGAGDRHGRAGPRGCAGTGHQQRGGRPDELPGRSGVRSTDDRGRSDCRERRPARTGGRPRTAAIPGAPSESARKWTVGVERAITVPLDRRRPADSAGARSGQLRALPLRPAGPSLQPAPRRGQFLAAHVVAGWKSRITRYLVSGDNATQHERAADILSISEVERVRGGRGRRRHCSRRSPTSAGQRPRSDGDPRG